jgi:hypothetical protein
MNIFSDKMLFHQFVTVEGQEVTWETTTLAGVVYIASHLNLCKGRWTDNKGNTASCHLASGELVQRCF